MWNSTNEFVTSRLSNQTNTAEGSNVPPRLQAGQRVPLVTNLRVIKSTQFFGGTDFVLSWNPPVETAGVQQFNVFVLGLLPGNLPSGPFTTRTAPAQIRLQANAEVRITFVVQTQMASGLTSDLRDSPSCTAVLTSASLVATDIPDGSIPLDKLVGMPSVPGRVLFVDSTGDGIGTSADLFFDTANGLLGVGTSTPHSPLTVAGAPAYGVAEIDANTSLTEAAHLWLVDTTSGTVQVELPDPTTCIGREYVVKKIDASVNLVQIVVAGSGTIDGATQVDLGDQYFGHRLMAGPAEWHVTGSFVI
jgi:hypothetical protein